MPKVKSRSGRRRQRAADYRLADEEYGYNDDDEEEQMTTAQVLLSYSKSPLFLAGMLFFTAFCLMSDGTTVMQYIWGSSGEKYEGHLPNSLLTLNYPYTMMRGIVLEQPVHETDVPVFWHPHRSDEPILKAVLATCYGAEVVELDSHESIQKAKEVKLASRGSSGQRFAVLSPFFASTMEMLTMKNLGRGICFFRHPLDYDFYSEFKRDLANLDDDKKSKKKKGSGDGETSAAEDNPLVRYLLSKKTGELTFKDLGDAKQIIRDVCVVSTMDKTTESIERAAAYLGWSATSPTCVEDIVNPNIPTPRFVDHGTTEWDNFYKDFHFDCQLYEFAEQAWRAQIQTIIPLTLQQQREQARQQQLQEAEEE